MDRGKALRSLAMGFTATDGVQEISVDRAAKHECDLARLTAIGAFGDDRISRIGCSLDLPALDARAQNRKFAPPAAVAGIVAALASDDGFFVTGTEMRIDGGTHMWRPSNDPPVQDRFTIDIMVRPTGV